MMFCCRCDSGNGVDTTDRCWLQEGAGLVEEKDAVFILNGFGEVMNGSESSDDESDHPTKGDVGYNCEEECTEEEGIQTVCGRMFMEGMMVDQCI